MSTQETVNPEIVEETRQQLRGLVHEIETLARSGVEAREFYEGFLTRIVSAMAAVGGAVWTVGSGGKLELVFQVNLRETRLADSEANQQRHGQLLGKTIASGQGTLVAPNSGDETAGNPTDCLLVLGLLRSDQEVEGVLEIFQRSGGRPTVERGYLRFVMQMCELAGDYLKTRRLRHFTDRQTLWSRLESFTRTAHQSLDPLHTAYTIANEGRRLIECDRVSVAIRRGNRCHIEAVSGQEVFDKRSNTVLLLADLASAVCATGEEVWYTGDTGELPPQVEDALQTYVDDSHTKMVAVLPLRRPLEDASDEEAEPNPVIGAIIVEQIEESRLAEGLKQRVMVVSDHSSTAMANALQHRNVFLMPLWQALGRASWVVKARTLPKTLTAVAVAAVLLLALFIIPADFYLQGLGTLEPVIKQDVFASVEGTIEEVLVKHGDTVAQGQPLLRLRNTDLEINKQKIMGDMLATSQQIEGFLRSLNEEKRPDEKTRLNSQLQQARKTVASLGKQLQLYQDKEKELVVRSPIAGSVVTWQVHEKLIYRSVEKGVVLLTIAQQEGDWRLEVHMPESRMGHVSAARQQLGPNEKMNVTYILATDPGTKRTGTVTEIQGAAQVKGEEGNVVLVKVAIDKTGIPELRSGATVTAKVYCGRRSLGYTWFHDVIAFVQSKVLFRI